METNPLTPEQMAAFAAMMQGQQAAPAANQQPTQYQQPQAPASQAQEPAAAAVAPPASKGATYSATDIAAIVARAKAEAAAQSEKPVTKESVSEKIKDFMLQAEGNSSRVVQVVLSPKAVDAQGNPMRSPKHPELVVLENGETFTLRSENSAYGAHDYLNVLEPGMVVHYGKSKHVDHYVIYGVE